MKYLISGLLLALAACGAVEQDTSGQRVERAGKAAPVLHTLSTGKPITALAVIPATGHRGAAKIAVAHGENGSAIYALDGGEVWSDDTPSKLVAFYQGHLVVYRDHEQETRLDRYRIFPNGKVEFSETTSPSPIAATTLQRTSYALLGPVRIDGTDVRIGDDTISTGRPVAAVASSKNMIPITSDLTLLLASADGQIDIGVIEAFEG